MEREIAVNNCIMLINLKRMLQRTGQVLSAGLMNGIVVLWNEDQPDKPHEGRKHHSWINFIKWNIEYVGLGCRGDCRFATAGEDGVYHLRTPP
jgi:hypothetical protein